jgi:HEAT repeat protein
MPSLAFKDFYESYFGDPYMAWHDGLDEEALLSLEGEERDEAERLLLENLDSGDYRPASGLATLRSQNAASPLKQLLKTAHGKTLVDAALGLWRIERYAPAVPAIIGVLRDSEFWGDRADAARALEQVRTKESVDALWEALDDPEDLVRSHAADSLMEMHGIDTAETGLHPLSIEMMSGDKAERLRTIKELKKLLKGKPLQEDSP